LSGWQFPGLYSKPVPVECNPRAALLLCQPSLDGFILLFLYPKVVLTISGSATKVKPLLCIGLPMKFDLVIRNAVVVGPQVATEKCVVCSMIP
jgi:hypothetical protein